MMRFVSAGVVFFCSTVSVWGADYATTVLSHSPLGYYRLNEAAGTIALDSALPAQDGTYTNGPLLNQPGPPLPGFSGSNTAVQFDGTNDVVFNNSLPFSNFTTYSAEGWVNNTRPNNAVAITGYVLSRGSGALNANFDALGIMGTFGNQGRLFLFNTATVLEGHSTVSTNEWHHVAYTRSGTNVAIYLDGALQRTPAGAFANTLNSNNFYIGTRSDSLFPTQGWIDEVAVYDNAALTGKQINAHYNAAFSTGLYSINNANFELQDVDVAATLTNQTGMGDGGYSNDIIRGWTGNNTQFFGVFDTTNAEYAGTTNDVSPVLGGNGDQVGYITTTGQVISVSQTLPDPIQAGKFDFTLAIGSRLNRGSAGYLLELLAGETVVAQEVDAINLNSLAGRLTDRTISFTVPQGSSFIGQLLTLRISNTQTSGLLSTDFDNARLVFTALAVPEPSSVFTMLIMLLGLIVPYIVRNWQLIRF